MQELERIKALFKNPMRAPSSPAYDTKHPNYHVYDVIGPVAPLQPGFEESVRYFNRLHPAPGTFGRTQPVRDGEPNRAEMGFPGDFDDFGPIVHGVIDDGRVVINWTAPAHKLAPGYVARIVKPMGNMIMIRTVGEGIGPMGTLNNMLANGMWNMHVNGHIRSQIMRYQTSRPRA